VQETTTRDVDTAGFGETRRVASNDAQKGRRRNRRVDMVVTGEPIGGFDAAGIRRLD
jgi:flagellar motor protein MotB